MPLNPFVHDPAWGWWIIWYFYLGGLAAGCYFLATLVELFGAEEDRPLARVGYRIAFPLVVACGVLLIVDLDRPERFWHMVLQSEAVDEALAAGWPFGGWSTMLEALMLKWWSPMSIGAQALGLFGVCSFISFVAAWRRPKPAAGPPGKVRGAVHLAFKIVGCVVGFFVASYTGVLLTATNQPVWSSTDWISPLFLASAASTACALLLLLARNIGPTTRERLERADLWALAVELFVFLIFLASLGALFLLVFTTWEGWLLVPGVLLVGILLPLWLHLGFTETAEGASKARARLAALSALLGGFLLRWGVVQVSPALLHRFAKDPPPGLDEPLWNTWTGKALLAASALTVLLLPYLLWRRWRLPRSQAFASGLVAAGVLAAVTFYSLQPADSRPLLDPLSGTRLSPEAGRERGGGVGASVTNRPQKLHRPGKIDAD